MHSDKTDEEIILAYRENNGDEFKELVERYTPIIFNFVARLTGRENAPDLVQEVFIKAWKHIRRFDAERASFKTWIFTIAKNTATDFLRKKKSLNFSDLEKVEDENTFAETIPDTDLLPDEILAKLADSKILNDTLDKLRLNYREVLILHYQEEMTFEEISKILGRPANSVKSDHRRALIELRQMLS